MLICAGRSGLGRTLVFVWCRMALLIPPLSQAQIAHLHHHPVPPFPSPVPTYMPDIPVLTGHHCSAYERAQEGSSLPTVVPTPCAATRCFFGIFAAILISRTCVSFNRFGPKIFLNPPEDKWYKSHCCEYPQTDLNRCSMYAWNSYVLYI